MKNIFMAVLSIFVMGLLFSSFLFPPLKYAIFRKPVPAAVKEIADGTKGEYSLVRVDGRYNFNAFS